MPWPAPGRGREAELATTEERAAAVNRRLYSGEVTASRELQAMAADVDSLKARASDLEDQVLEILESANRSTRRVAALAAKALAGLAGRRDEAVAVLADGGRGRPRPGRAGRAAGGGGRGRPGRPARHLRAAAEPPRTAWRSPASSGTHCDGCHLSLSATELDRIRHLPARRGRRLRAVRPDPRPALVAGLLLVPGPPPGKKGSCWCPPVAPRRMRPRRMSAAPNASRAPGTTP